MIIEMWDGLTVILGLVATWKAVGLVEDMARASVRFVRQAYGTRKGS